MTAFLICIGVVAMALAALYLLVKESRKTGRAEKVVQDDLYIMDQVRRVNELRRDNPERQRVREKYTRK